MKIVLLLLFAIIMCIGCVSDKNKASRDKVSFYGKFGGRPVEIKPNARQLAVHGAWVATLNNLDIGMHKNAESYKEEIVKLFDKLAAAQVNTIFFQVRSWNDAYYSSKINPWSRWLTGQEGRSIPGLDPLQVALEEAHKRKMSLHAWINPYRVSVIKVEFSKAEALGQLSPGNFARQHPECVLTVADNKGRQYLLLDPGMPASQKHISDTVDELLENYAVDGIHLDDYFYPSTPMGNQDANTALLHNTDNLSIDDWRRSNIDSLILKLSTRIRSFSQKKKRRIEFGISPFGIWANRKHNPAGSLTAGLESYYTTYSDSRKWVQNDWIDYIVPQLYWSFDNPLAAFAGLVEWWASQTAETKVKLYIGMALYQTQPGGKWHGTDEIEKQLAFIRQYPQVQGAVMFRARSF